MSLSAADVGAASIVARSKFLTFFLDDEEYGLEISTVHEIIGAQPITQVPRTPAFVRGVINLRGKIVPVIDLRARLHMTPATADAAVIVVELGAAHVGLTVDRVSEVLEISTSDIEPAPSFGPDVDTDYLLGVARADGRVRLLLALDRVLGTDVEPAVDSAA